MVNMQLYSRPKPHHILEEIVLHKQEEIAQMQTLVSASELQFQVADPPLPRNFLKALQQSPSNPSIIAEVKKASPSKGVIRADFDPVAIAQSYERGGAACISVLTDRKFFQGSFENLRAIRQKVSLPLLCKEFIIDPYQIYLARAAGADAVLLIAGILSYGELLEFSLIIRELGMTALVEVHSLDELDRILTLPNLQLVGINNRNLEDFTVDLKTTQRLMRARRSQFQDLGITVVSESGLHTPDDLVFVAEWGARAVLIGESLVKQTNLEQAVQRISNVRFHISDLVEI